MVGKIDSYIFKILQAALDSKNTRTTVGQKTRGFRPHPTGSACYQSNFSLKIYHATGFPPFTSTKLPHM